MSQITQTRNLSTRRSGRRTPTPSDAKRQADRNVGLKALKGLTFGASAVIKTLGRGVGEVGDFVTGRDDHRGDLSDQLTNKWGTFKFRWES